MKEISNWGLGVPVQKDLRGFGDDVCGHLLCPADQDWADPIVRQRVQSFNIPITHNKFPRFLWENEQYDPQDTNRGFLRGQLLVKTLLAILIGPSAARCGGQSSGAGGYADLLNLQTITIPSIAFAAVVARYALSTEHKCLWSVGQPEFNNLKFYNQIVSNVKAWHENDRKALIVWWNRTILSHLHGGIHSGPFSDDPEPGSVAAAMLQQAVAGGRNDSH